MEKKTTGASFSETKPREWFLMLKDVSLDMLLVLGMKPLSCSQC